VNEGSKSIYNNIKFPIVLWMQDVKNNFMCNVDLYDIIYS
jgi:hypothetical protein